jgi:integrase
MAKLTVNKVRNAKPQRNASGSAMTTRFADGSGLYLMIKPTGAKSWILRVQVAGQRRDIGLGSVDVEGPSPSVFPQGDERLGEVPIMLKKSLTLAEAREKAAALRKLAKAGLDPVVERDRERRIIPTFAVAVDEAHKALARGWADKTSKAFLASLTEHAVPKLGPLKVNAIGSNEIILALAPIWNDKPVIARKVRARILQVLAFAKSRGWRNEALPDAREMRGGLAKQARGGNFAAMPFAEVPKFMAAELAKPATSSRNALLFAILTAARSGEVRQATWEQIDLDERIWTRPADVMKSGVGHVVTLSNAAVTLLEKVATEDERKGLLFTGQRGGELSDMSLTKALRTAGRSETVHGFRSAFRDWAAERMPTIPAMVAEMALAHRVGTATEQAYLRSDLRDMRRKLIEAWGLFAAPALSGVGDNVVPIGAAKESA